MLKIQTLNVIFLTSYQTKVIHNKEAGLYCVVPLQINLFEIKSLFLFSDVILFFRISLNILTEVITKPPGHCPRTFSIKPGFFVLAINHVTCLWEAFQDGLKLYRWIISGVFDSVYCEKHPMHSRCPTCFLKLNEFSIVRIIRILLKFKSFDYRFTL